MQIKSTSFSSPSEVSGLETLKVIDKYVIKNYLLGEGSYAKTYLALHSGSQIVACKMIAKKTLIQKINRSSNKEFAQDFLTTSIRNEVNVWKNLRNQNIALFKDFRQTENNVYFFIEYCADGTLESLINNKKLDYDQSIEIFKQIVDGCEYLYDMGILHRDLKPQNIMLHRGIVKIADFGFAKFVEDEYMKTNCIERTYVGTPVYMSPQGLMRQPYSIKCDVWSIGVIFYRLLCGTLPWKKFEVVEKLIEAVKTSPPFPEHILKIHGLKELILRMLSFAQKDRIEVKQILAQLQAIKQTSFQ